MIKTWIYMANISISFILIIIFNPSVSLFIVLYRMFEVKKIFHIIV